MSNCNSLTRTSITEAEVSIVAPGLILLSCLSQSYHRSTPVH